MTMATPPFQGVISGLTLETCTSNCKNLRSFNRFGAVRIGLIDRFAAHTQTKLTYNPMKTISPPIHFVHFAEIIKLALITIILQ